MRIVRLPWSERLQDWWKCSVCGSRLGHHNPLYEENHELRDRIQCALNLVGGIGVPRETVLMMIREALAGEKVK